MSKKRTSKNTKGIFKFIKQNIKTIFLWGILAFFILGGVFIIWATTISLPDLNSFDERRVAQSTKIYDRTGEIVLYDVYGEYKRTVIPLEEISDHLQKATIAVEDQDFYEHNGIQFSAIFRAIVNNIKKGDLLGGQGGSTITQQVIKNALLTRDKKISRKLKEWVLAPRLEKVLTKDEILEVYLNEVPYGGSVYGIQEAARRFFGKDAKDLDLVESVYLAALPQAPTYYSPYGNHTDALEYRKNHVLDQMFVSGYITEIERDSAKNASVTFEKPQEYGIKAPHFVIYIREILEEKYGKELIQEGGLKVITSLDWKLQEQAEEIIKRNALSNVDRFDAENASLISTDPKTGEILVMVGSRDYFDEEIDGNFNVATALRQPGSTFKPIVYAEAFNKGYRPETVVFDLPTEFSSTCEDNPDSCYSPVNYDGKFRGPMSLRDALAQSINVPAVKMLYLSGMRDSLNLAKNMGIDTLTNVDQYGLTLVLGGGEVTPLDMAQVYGVFATEGLRNELNGILKIEDQKGEIIFEPEVESERVLSEQTARLISDVLSDDNAKIPSYGTVSPLYFDGRVAAKTGTTNDFRDAWTIGYTPNIVTVTWAGNNDNRSMDKKVAGLIVTPMWREFMNVVLEELEHDNFNSPDLIDPNIKPILAGYWRGEETEVYDAETGKKATEDTKDEDKVIAVTGGGNQGIHSILYWVDKNNPLGPKPSNPYKDIQYKAWEEAVVKWSRNQNISDNVEVTDTSEIKQEELMIISPENGKTYFNDAIMVVSVRMSDRRDIKSGEVFLNTQKIGDLETQGDSLMFIPNEIDEIQSKNKLKVVIKDQDGKEFTDEISFNIE